LHAYIAAAGIGDDLKGWLFRTAKGWNGSALSDQYVAGLGITAYLENGGTLEATKPYNHYYLALTS
jgi:hypothetical protein